MGGNVGNGHNAADVFVPRVTRDMMVRAALIVCGSATGADDAKFLLDTLGITDDILVEAAG